MDCLCTLEALVGVTPFYNGIRKHALSNNIFEVIILINLFSKQPLVQEKSILNFTRLLIINKIKFSSRILIYKIIIFIIIINFNGKICVESESDK